MISYILSPLLIYLLFVYCPVEFIVGKQSEPNVDFLFRLLFSLLSIYIITTVDCFRMARSDGLKWKYFQNLKFWKYFVHKYFDGRVELEVPLDHKQLYIFCSFPHGTVTAGHLLTMTDACGMLSNHYQGERRDLCASILFTIPILREVSNSLC